MADLKTVTKNQSINQWTLGRLAFGLNEIHMKEIKKS